MTPMQMLKNQFDEFKLIAKDFKEVTLNKSEPKLYISHFCGEREVHEDRGVKADFIKLFKIKYNKEDQYTIGFEFKYLDLKEEDFRVKVSVKQGEDNFVLGEFVTIPEFKEIFVKFMNEVKIIDNLENKELVAKIESEFNLVAPQVRKKKWKNK